MPSSKKDLKMEIPNALPDTVKPEVIAPKRIDSVIVAPVLTRVITTTGAFAIQVGVNSHLAKAKATQASLKKVFKQPVIIVNEGGVFKVRISGFDTYDDAKLLLSKIRETGFPDAFIVSPKKE